MVTTKVKRKLLAELKQLKIRQKCVEKSITWPIKLNDLEDDELEFLKIVEKMKTDNEKRFKAASNESYKTTQECLSKVHKFQETISTYDDEVIASRPSEILKVMAEINLLISENLYICNKEMTSLKFQSDQC